MRVRGCVLSLPSQEGTTLEASSTSALDSKSVSHESEEDVETWMASDAEYCVFQMLKDNEIVTSVQEESNLVHDEMDEDENNNNNESNKGSSNADALETAMQWYVKQ
ncbi:hypothetical protein TNCV_2703081 [Trichonephila clavipes]|nr:hypothetical protein TNCV_2703081 [Trichonephila clavipes]